MANGQFIYVSPTGDPTHGGVGRISIEAVDEAFADATPIHQTSDETVSSTDVFIDYLTLDAVNVTSSQVTIRVYIAADDFPITVDVPAKGAPPLFINDKPWPMTKGFEVRATIVGPGSANDVHLGCRVDRFQQAAAS